MTEGSATGQVVELGPMLDEYYELRGWDKEIGVPKRDTLEVAGLHEIADDLYRFNVF